MTTEQQPIKVLSPEQIKTLCEQFHNDGQFLRISGTDCDGSVFTHEYDCRDDGFCEAIKLLDGILDYADGPIHCFGFGPEYNPEV